MRRLLCTRRRVPLDVADDYLIAWAYLRAQVEAAGGRAWIFRGAGHEDRFLEFIEWDDATARPLEVDAVSDARTELERFAHVFSLEEWEETG
jgi:hypothetical protein